MAKDLLAQTEVASSFDPEGEGYDMESALKAGIKADSTGHFASRDPQSGLLLKGANHKTFQKTLDGEEEAGYEVYKNNEDGRYYSREKEQEGARDLLAPQKTPTMNYNSLDLLSEDATSNNFFIDRAKAMWDSIPNWKEIPKAVARDTEGILGSVSGLLVMAGDIIKVNDDIKARYENNGMDSKRIAFADAVGDWVIELGKTAKDFWTEESMKGWEAPNEEIFEGTFLENPSWIRAFSLGAGAVPSMGAAVVASVATGNPLVGAGFLGLLEGEPIYAEAREAGLSEEKALGLFAIGAGLITATEYLPMERFMKGGSGRLIKDIVIGFLIEGSQEGTQQITSNLVRKYGIDSTVNVFEGVIESVIAGALSGAGMGGTTSKLLNNGVKNRIKKVEDAAVKAGMSSEEVDGMIEVVSQAIVAKNEAIEDVVVKHRDKVLAERKKALEATEEDKRVLDEKGEPITVGMEDPLATEAKKYKTAEEFVVRGFEAIQKELFGVNTGDIVSVPIEQITIKWQDDLNNAEDEARKQDITDETEPVKFGFDIKTNKYILEDGHNRYVAARRQGIPLRGEIDYTEGNYEELAEIYKNKTGQQLTDIWNKAQPKEDTSFEFGENIVDAVKPDAKGKTAVEKKLEAIQDAKVAREQAEAMREPIVSAMQEFKNRIKDKEYEGTKIPTYYRTNNENAQALDLALDEFNNQYGTELKMDEFVDWLVNTENTKKALDEIISKSKEEMNKKIRLETALKNQLRAKELGVKLGAREQRKLTEQEQEKIIAALDKSKLTGNDKAKFIKSLKNVKDMETITERIAKLETAQVVRETRTKIGKELKTTKPTKQGAIRKGKYDYETNTTFNILREYSKLTQDKAQELLDGMPEEGGSRIDLIRARFLSLQANGSQASTALAKSVLADIQYMKVVGKDAKDEESLIRTLEQADKVIDVRRGIKSIKGSDKVGIRTKIVNLYRKGFSDIYAMLNSTVGKNIAEEYDPVLAELSKSTAVNRRSIEGAKAIAEALGIKKSQFANVFNQMVEEQYPLTREDLSGEITLSVTMWDILDMYNAIKNEKTKENYYRVYGEEQVEALVSKVRNNPNLMAAADYMQEEVQRNYEIQNERNIELTGRDLGQVDNYWPATSLIPLNLQQGMRIQGETPGSRKERAKGGVTPIPKNSYLKFQKSNVEAEHERFLSRTFENLKRVFANPAVQADFEKKYGKGVYKVLMQQIDNLSLNTAQTEIDAIEGLMGKGLNNWVVAKIALNPSVFVKQLLSVGNYMEVMPPGQWAKHFTKGVMSPKATFDFMWKNIPDLEARFNKGYSEALEHVMSESGRMGSKKQAWTNGMTFMVRTGDIGAIIYGGYPVIQEHLKNNPGDMKGAIDKFNLATQKSQQSGLKSTRSQFQNSNHPIFRLFLAFKNTANQYFRKQVNATVSFYQGDISKAQYAKTMAIYAVIQPALYGAAGFAMRGMLYGSNDEEDSIFASILEAIALSPFNAVPVLNDVVKAAIRKMKGDKVWKIISMPLLDDISQAFKTITKEDVEIEEVMYELASLTAEVTTGTPVKTYEKIFGHIFGEGESSGW